MIYLDYSATTPVNEEVLNTYIKTTKQMIRESAEVQQTVKAALSFFYSAVGCRHARNVYYTVLISLIQ